MVRQLKIGGNYIWLFGVVLFLVACAPQNSDHKPQVHTVGISQMKFQPAELTVQKGDTVVWKNNDIVAHDVTEESTRAWSSSLLQPGESWSLVVTKSANYYCSIHVVMKGKLIVQE